MAKGSGTRSGLLWEVERLLDECKELPQVLVMENVPAVIGAKNIQHFAKWQEKLESLGYKNKWQVLNAKDYGIPQNRERCFMVSLLGDYYYEFPKTIPLKLRLKDMLETEVDEKYYLSSRALNGMLNTSFNCSTLEARTEKDGVMPTLCARDYKDPKLVVEDKGLKQELCDELIEKGIKKLKSVLRKHKNISNKDIAEKLNKPITLVEHWFRNDDCFSIPDADIWFKLKDLLGINTTEFDKAITTFIEKPNVFEMGNRGYLDSGLSPTLTATEQPNVVQEPLAYDEQNQYLRQDGCVGTLTTDGSSPKHNNRIIEPISYVDEKYYFSDKTINQILNWKSYENPLDRCLGQDSLCPTITTRVAESPDGGINASMRVYSDKLKETTDMRSFLKKAYKENENQMRNYRIRKLTPKECWRLMGFADEDVDNATYIKKNYKIEDLFDKEKYTKCFVKSTDAIEKPLQKNMVAYALNITSVLADMGITSIKWKEFQNKQDYENSNLVNIAITPLAKLAQGECATSITKCLLYTETLYGLTKELDQRRTAIIELENEGKQNTAKYMKISLEENLTPMKLYIILTVLRQITASKIYISTLQRVNIQGRIANCENYEKNMEIALLSNFEMECTYTRVSSSQLYKQAGNSIVVNVLMAIFKQML